MNNDEIEFDVEESGEEMVKKLRERLKTCLAERQEYLNGWQRAKADFVNARKEEEGRRAELTKFAEEKLLLELIPVLDSFDLATGNRDAWERVSKEWRIGMESIQAQLLGILKVHQVQVFDPIEEPFSPIEHVAVSTLETDDIQKDHTVAAVLQKGYRLNGKIIRPAHVTIYTKNK